MFELAMPDPKLKSSQAPPESIPRWEDDGGSVFEPDPVLPQAAEINTPRPKDVSRDDLPYDGNRTNH